MQFEFQNEDGDVKLKNIKLLKDVKTLESGTPRIGSTCSFRILSVSNVSTGEDEKSTSASLAESKYFIESNVGSVDPITATIGVTCVSEQDRLIEVCLTRLHVGEVGEFYLKCSRSKTSFEICLELVSIKDSPELFDLGEARLLEIAEDLKNQGVGLFKLGHVVDSFYKFSQAFKFISVLPPMSSEAHQNLTTNLQSNMAGCHVKLQNWEETIDLCNEVITNDGNNVKALYRRGLSFIEIQEFEKASIDLQKAKRLDPGNQAVKTKLVLLDEKRKALDAKYAQAMKKFFS